MSDCCQQLKAEIAALRAAIAALDDKYIPKSQKRQIIDEALSIANTLFLGMSFKSQVSGMISNAVNPVNAKAIEALSKAFNAESVAGAAKGKAENALSNAIDAQLKSKAARDAATAAGQTATRAKTVATTANDVATTAKNAAGGAQRTADQAKRFADASKALAETAQGTAEGAKTLAERGKTIADKALGGINKVEGALDRVEGKLQDAVGKAAKALGASEAALSKAGSALSRAGDAMSRVAGLVGVVAGLLALVGTFVSFSRIEALERRVDRIDADVSRSYGLIELLNGRIKRVDEAIKGVSKYFDEVTSIHGRDITELYQMAGSALELARRGIQEGLAARSEALAAARAANNAERMAQVAQGQAQIAALQAAGAAAAIGTVAGMAGNALQRAADARRAADAARGLAGRPGPRGERGPQGIPGPRGLQGTPGRNGSSTSLSPAAVVQIVNANARQVANNIRPFVINTGSGATEGMRPQDLALLRRIDSTTRANLATSRSNSVQASIMLGLQQRTNGLIANVQNTANTINQNLGKLAKWLHLDRLLNLLTFVTSFHNAYQLSSAVGQTLFSATSNVLAVFGMKDANGSPIDVGSLIGGSLDAQMKAIFGVEEWNGMKAEWKQYNRAYQAGANLLFSIQSMVYNVQESINIVAGWIAQMGNGLRKDGVVSEGVWRRFNPNPDFKNPFFSSMEKLENLEEATSQIDQIASNVLSVQQTGAEIVKQKEELHKSVAQVTGGKEGTIAPDATKVAEVEAATKLISKSVVIPQSAELAGA